MPTPTSRSTSGDQGPPATARLRAIEHVIYGAPHGAKPARRPRDTPMTLEQGDLRLLECDLAQRLLASTIPARYAYTALDGTPRIVGSWFTWTGEEFVMPTFISAPHVSHVTYRVRTLRAHPDVANTADTETFPPEV